MARSDAAGCLNLLLIILVDSDLLFASFDGTGSSECNGDDAVTEPVTCLPLLNHCGANVGSLLSITLLMNIIQTRTKEKTNSLPSAQLLLSTSGANLNHQHAPKKASFSLENIRPNAQELNQVA